MKKLLILAATLCAAPVWSQNHNAGVRTSVLQIEPAVGVLYIRDFCMFGLQFAALVHSKKTTSQGSGGIGALQVLGEDGKPMKCGAKPALVN